MELRNICKAYGGKPVLKDFSCRIPDGGICAVMAPSGAGKTTLLRLILELEEPDSGEIIGVPKLKSAVFQENRLCPGLTVLGNIRAAVPGVQKEDMLTLLQELGIGDAAQQKASELSGGMARRAALARALLCPGDLLVLDEPFTGLDEETRVKAAEAILRCRRQRTLLFVTHQKEDLLLLGAEQCITIPE